MIKLFIFFLFLMQIIGFSRPLMAISFEAYTKMYYQNLHISGHTSNQVSSSNRLTIRQSTENITAEVSTQGLLKVSDQVIKQNLEFISKTPYRVNFKAANIALSEDEKSQLSYQIDRLFVSYINENYTMTIGRQSFSIGTALFINPLDIFNPFAINSLDTEERSGIDALRLKFYLDPQSHIDTAILLSSTNKAEENAYVLRYLKSNLWGDIAFIAAQFKKQMTLGIDAQTQVSGNGVNISIVQTHGESLNYFRSSLGIFRLFPQNLLISGEYHYNGIGQTTIDQQKNLINNPDWLNAQVLYLGRHYFSLSIQKDLTALTQFSGSVTTNITDKSLIPRSTLTVNTSQDQYFDLGMVLGVGSRQSEFRAFGSHIYSSYRWYF